MNLRNLSFTIIISLLTLSCGDEPDSTEDIKMNDGNTITISTKSRHYNSYNEFISASNFYGLLNKNLIPTEDFNYGIDKIDQVEGYDAECSGNWEKSTFGDWCIDFGLKPNEVYYVCTSIYQKAMPPLPKDCVIAPYKSIDYEMGINPGLTDLGYTIDDGAKGQLIFTTLTRTIGYDNFHNPIFKNIPFIKDKITWCFFVSSKDGNLPIASNGKNEPMPNAR